MDPYTGEAELCDETGECFAFPGWVCTGSEHINGEHIRCTSPHHIHEPPDPEFGVPADTQAAAPC